MTDLWAKLKPRKQGLAPEQLAQIEFKVSLPQACQHEATGDKAHD